MIGKPSLRFLLCCVAVIFACGVLFGAALSWAVWA